MTGAADDRASVERLTVTGKMLLERIEKWIADAQTAGHQEGRQQGAAALLLRLLERRFGPLTGRARKRVQEAEIAHLEQWGMRLLDARNLADVFADRPT